MDVKALAPLPAPVPLEGLKTEPAFEGSLLLRQGRLSVVPLSPAEWRALTELADIIAKTGGRCTTAIFERGALRGRSVDPAAPSRATA